MFDANKQWKMVCRKGKGILKRSVYNSYSASSRLMYGTADTKQSSSRDAALLLSLLCNIISNVCIRIPFRFDFLITIYCVRKVYCKWGRAMTCYNDVKFRATGILFGERVIQPFHHALRQSLGKPFIHRIRPLHSLLAVFTPWRFINKFLMPTYLW